MYNMSEYILAKRATHIFYNASLTQQKYIDTSNVERSLGRLEFIEGEHVEPDKYLKAQKNLEFIMQAVFKGAMQKRFVSVYVDEMVTIPIMLFEIFEPTHAYIPVVMTQDSVLAISCFGSFDPSGHSKSKWVREIIPTAILMDDELDVSTIYDLLDVEVKSINTTTRYTVSDIIKDIMLLYAEENTKFEEVINQEFVNLSGLSVHEVSTESPIWNHAKDRFSMEALLKVENDYKDDLIKPSDFIPIYLKCNGEDGKLIVETLNENGRLKLFQTSSLSACHTACVKVPYKEGSNIMIYLDDAYYIGNNKLRIFMGYNCDTVDLFDLATIPKEVDMMNAMPSTEGIIGTTKDLLKSANIFGVRKGSAMYQSIMSITKLPRSLAKEAWNILKRSFRVRVEVEKDQALEFQEKLLNDELDRFREKVKYFAAIGVKAVAWTAVFGNILLLPLFIIIRRNSERKTKLGGIERLEFKLDGMIERTEAKLDAARSEGDPKAVDALLAEKHHLEFSRLKLIELKKDLTKTDRLQYMTFNKDDSMNARQRIDALMKSGGYFNIGNSYGNSYTVGTKSYGDY